MICNLCPRKCNVDRSVRNGFCKVPEQLKIARAALHFWEEPCISGEKGSGTIFFSGCSLGCIFCQNREIALGESGIEISRLRLVEIMLELQSQGANNINLVTPDHYAPIVRDCVIEAKEYGLILPVLVKTCGYVSREVYECLCPITDIWLTDFKYFSPDLASRYAHAPDYPEVALNALKWMVQDIGRPIFEDGMMKRGVIVRILLLPDAYRDAKHILDLLHGSFGDDIIISIMNQYVPPKGCEGVPKELLRKVTKKEYERLLDYALSIGITEAYIQEGGAAKESFIPAFDYTGVLKKE